MTVTTTPSSAPSTPPAPIGKVASFTASATGGTLTITLNDGSTLKGNVTSETEFECATAGDDDQGEDQSPGEDSSGRDEESGSTQTGDDDQSSSDQSGSDESGDDDEGAGDDESAGTTAPACGPAALTAGANVLGVELRMDSTGTTFEKIVLG
jgi:hypothetical protein